MVPDMWLRTYLSRRQLLAENFVFIEIFATIGLDLPNRTQDRSAFEWDLPRAVIGLQGDFGLHAAHPSNSTEILGLKSPIAIKV